MSLKGHRTKSGNDIVFNILTQRTLHLIDEMWKILLCCIFTSLTEENKVYRSEDDFSHKVETLLDQLKRNYSIGDTITKAWRKFEETEFETWNETKKSAALITYLFTSSDVISVEPEITFYRILQEQIRSGHPDEIWKRCEDLLNRALKIIGLETCGHLYRGERKWPASFPGEGQTYFVRSFWSTSLDPVTASYFSGNEDFFYHILGANGARIENISAACEEKEVLLPSTRSYVVVRVLRNVNEIRKELNRISKKNNGTDLSTFKPKVLIVLAEETYYIRMNITTGGTTHVATESEADLDLLEYSSGYKSLKEFKLKSYLAFCIYVLNKATVLFIQF